MHSRRKPGSCVSGNRTPAFAGETEGKFMGWFTGIIVYLLIWWTALFAVLPWGLRRDNTGRPENFNIKKKILVNTVLSAALWLIVYILIDMEIISFREMAKDFG